MRKRQQRRLLQQKIQRSNMAYDYEYFKKAVFDLTKIDLNAYKERQI